MEDTNSSSVSRLQYLPRADTLANLRARRLQSVSSPLLVTTHAARSRRPFFRIGLQIIQNDLDRTRERTCALYFQQTSRY